MAVTDVQFAPSILAADFSRLGEQVQAVAAAGAAQIHIDVMDGRFVPNITMGGIVVEAVRRSTSLPLDVHLMIVEPDHLLPAFRTAGADMITVHWETCPNLHRTLTTIQALGAKAGVAVNPATPVEVLSEVLPLIDQIVIMTVNPGFGGQALIPQTLRKIERARALIRANGRVIDLIADGGIHTGTARQVADAGANVLVVGSALFNGAGSIAAHMQALREAVAVSGHE
ncbi:MAG: ribulose-phosphate 3-epimerase [bacterium]|nr:ribulose-phosphate 3-epimerase [bacterium]